MAKELAPVHYESPAEDINGILDNYAWQIKRSYGAAGQSLMEVGKVLLAARDMLNDKKKFSEWVEKWFPFSVSSAYQYAVNYQHFGSSPESGLIEPSAQTALTKNPIAKKQALKIAANGKPVSLSLANKLIEKATPKPPRIDATKVEDAEFTVVASEANERPPVDEDSAEADSETGEDASTEAIGTKPKETSHRPPKGADSNGKEKPVDRGKCPNCAGTKWTEGNTHWVCAKCGHFYGEPVGDRDEDEVVDERLSIQRSKTVKTIEALMRAFDDLQTISPQHTEYADVIPTCKVLLKTAKNWN